MDETNLIALREYYNRIELLELKVRQLEHYKKAYLDMCYMIHGNNMKDKVLVDIQNMYPPQEIVDLEDNFDS